MTIRPPHDAICIPFEIKGEPFEAVGYLRDGFSSIRGCIALDWVDNGLIVKTREDYWGLLYKYRAQFPQKLQRYYLVTGLWGYFADVHGFRYNRVWYDFPEWESISLDSNCQWTWDALILRRRQPPRRG